MKLPGLARTQGMVLAGLVLAYVVSRILYERAGVVFDATTYAGYWQLIDPELLRTDLWRSIFHLHTQPPLMNLFIGLVFQVFPESAGAAFHYLYLLLGLTLTLAMYALGVWLRLPLWLAAGITALFMLSPATVIYEHWLFYAYPVICALVVAAAALFQFVRRTRFGWGLLFFSSLAALSLTWSLFHLAWLVGILVLLLAVLPRRKMTLATAALPVLLVVAWYAKNQWLVGQFTGSTWAGMNLSRITTFCMGDQERDRLIRTGYLSVFAEYPPFRNPDRYLRLLPETPVTGVPILDLIYTSRGDRNRHHLVYAEASKRYFTDAWRSLRARPDAYAGCVETAFLIAFRSPTDYERTLDNRAHIETLDLWWNRLVYGQWEHAISETDQAPEFAPQHLSLVSIACYAAALVGTGFYLWRHRHRRREPEFVVALFMAVNVLFTAIIANMIDLGENNRFRYTAEPFVFLLIGFLVNEWRATRQPGGQGRGDGHA